MKEKIRLRVLKHSLSQPSTICRFKLISSFSAFKILFLMLTVVIVIAQLTNLSIFLSLYKNYRYENKLKNDCRDWHDYKQMYLDQLRIGPGEKGAAVNLTNEDEIILNEKSLNETGFAVVVSDKISVNRSIIDTRHPDCLNFIYPSNLPNVSIIVIFHNEVFSVLLRTLHSIVNRTPAELLHEIILVNDMSSNEELYGPLQEYIHENFKNTRIVTRNLKKRSGLIVTRLKGAEVATGEVLVFFDSHIEVNVNWLPPLLAPIKANRRLATNPTVDYFSPTTFEVGGASHYSDRGGFDWNLIYRQFFRKVPEGYNKLKPYPNPIMLGCAFAIDRKLFMEELDGYDREFRIWNGENYELSFKLWLCADGLYEAPCSRITHTFRGHNPSRSNVGYDYVGRNFKRLVEVWFDDYKNVVYNNDRGRYDKIDPGNLTHVKSLRERLKCKNFQYFLDNVVPEMVVRYPIDKKSVPVFASGQIRLLKNESICLTYLPGHFNETVRLIGCNKNVKHFVEAQFFRMNFYKNIVNGYTELCLDSSNVRFLGCHYAKSGNQYWKYYKEYNVIVNGYDESDQCLTANLTSHTVYMKNCNLEDIDQKWKFTYENVTALNNWDNIYGYENYIYGGKKVNWDSMLPLEYDEECPIA